MSLDTPLSRLIQNFSWLGLKGSVNSRILFVYAFVISSLAAIGLDRLLDETLVSSNRTSRYSLQNSIYNRLPLILFIGIFLGLLGNYFYLSKIIKIQNLYLETVIIALRNSIWPFLLFLITIILIKIIRDFKIKFAAFGLIIFLLIDMLRFSWKYLPFTNIQLIFPTTPSLSFLTNQQKPFRISVEKGEVLTANTWATYGLESLSGYNILLPKTTANFISYLNHGKLDSENSRFIDIKNFNSRLLDIANSEFVVALKRSNNEVNAKGKIPPELSTPKYQVVLDEGPVSILRNLNSLDRFYTVDKYKVITDESETYFYISSSNFDIKNEVVLSTKPNIDSLTKCQIALKWYTGQTYLLNTKCSNKSLLVLSNAYHPGWSATINNQKVNVLKANGNFMAIVLPSGNSIVKLEFLPKSFLYGFLVSILSVILLLFMFTLKIFLKVHK